MSPDIDSQPVTFFSIGLIVAAYHALSWGPFTELFFQKLQISVNCLILNLVAILKDCPQRLLYFPKAFSGFEGPSGIVVENPGIIQSSST